MILGELGGNRATDGLVAFIGQIRKRYTHRHPRRPEAAPVNPNWIALAPRAAFFLLGEFAIAESRRVALGPDFGGLPKKRRIAERLKSFLADRPDAAGVGLLTRSIHVRR